MNTKKILVIFITLILLTVVGCNNLDNVQTTDNDGSISDVILKEVLDVEFEVNQMDRGYSIFEYDNKSIIVISLGKQNTGGFDILAPTVSQENNSYLIKFEEVIPDGMVAEVITYPTKLFWLNDDFNTSYNIKVVNNIGEEFSYIEPVDNANTLTGIYIGQMDPHTIEIEINGKPIGFQILEVMDEFTSLGIVEGDIIEFSYIEKDTNEKTITDINKAN